jgi:hypothetical protein
MRWRNCCALLNLLDSLLNSLLVLLLIESRDFLASPSWDRFASFLGGCRCRNLDSCMRLKGNVVGVLVANGSCILTTLKSLKRCVVYTHWTFSFVCIHFVVWASKFLGMSLCENVGLEAHIDSRKSVLHLN